MVKGPKAQHRAEHGSEPDSPHNSMIRCLFQSAVVSLVFW
jgi:hypothetical protein